MTSIADGAWRLDPDHSTVEFHAPSLYGLITVKGSFAGYAGTLDLSARPAIELTIEAGSLDTANKRRDKHLGSAHFFDVESHPQVRFESDDVRLAGESLMVRGRLHAAGKHVPLEVEATLREVDGQPEIEARALADHRALGMTFNPLGLVGAQSRLIVRGRLLRTERRDAPAVDGAALAGARPSWSAPTSAR